MVINGASKVVITDYPDHDLIENLSYNVKHCDPVKASKAMITTEVNL